MPRRRTILRVLTISALTVPLLYLAITRLNAYRDRARLFANCYSDAFPSLTQACESAARANDGRFPDPATILTHLDPATPTPAIALLTCAGSHHPFVWNPRLTTLSLSTPGPVPLLWCPPNSHGRYTGALLLTNGRIVPAMITQPELTTLLQRHP